MFWHAATRATHFVLVNSSVQTDVMAAQAQLNQEQIQEMQEATQEYFFFLQTFAALGASGEVAVTDVYNRMRDQGLPTGLIRRYMDNTDPTANAPTTAARGKT